MNAHLYHVNIKWDKDRVGMMCSPELTRSTNKSGCIEIATPPEFPKGIAGIWSPEHLFTASVVSCFMTTFLAIAENSKISFSGFECRATGKLEYIDNKPLMTEILLEPFVNIYDDTDTEKLKRVLFKSESNCLISNSIKTKVTLLPMVTALKDSVRQQ